MLRNLVIGVAAVTISTAAFAAVNFDPATGTGFVGKGDVQLTLGLNNAQLQALGTPTFTYQEFASVEWTCTKTQILPNGNVNETEQQRTNTTTTYGVFASEARVRNQITGFNLTGFSTPLSTTTDGPAVGSCPANPSGFVYDDNAVSSIDGGGFFINGVELVIAS